MFKIKQLNNQPRCVSIVNDFFGEGWLLFKKKMMWSAVVYRESFCKPLSSSLFWCDFQQLIARLVMHAIVSFLLVTWLSKPCTHRIDATFLIVDFFLCRTVRFSMAIALRFLFFVSPSLVQKYHKMTNGRWFYVESTQQLTSSYRLRTIRRVRLVVVYKKSI